MCIAPPGPPQEFKAQVLSDMEIILTWKALELELTTPAVYGICYNALSPVCIDISVSIVPAFVSRCHITMYKLMCVP